MPSDVWFDVGLNLCQHHFMQGCSSAQTVGGRHPSCVTVTAVCHCTCLGYLLPSHGVLLPCFPAVTSLRAPITCSVNHTLAVRLFSCLIAILSMSCPFPRPVICCPAHLHRAVERASPSSAVAGLWHWLGRHPYGQLPNPGLQHTPRNTQPSKQGARTAPSRLCTAASPAQRTSDNAAHYETVAAQRACCCRCQRQCWQPVGWQPSQEAAACCR